MTTPVKNSPLRKLDQATAGWLAEILTSHDFEFGAIKQVNLESVGGPNSQGARLKIEYKNAASNVPHSLFLKLSGGPNSDFGNTEVKYYTEIVTGIEPSPAPKCFDAAYDSIGGYYHLLLEDLCETHTPCWEIKPTLQSATLAVKAIARLHAHWWRHPDLEKRIGQIPDATITEAYTEKARVGFPFMLNAARHLSASERDLIQRVFELHPRMMVARVQQNAPMTCIHGDPNPGNILIPTSEEGRAYIIDRQPFSYSLVSWLGVSDLAYMMVHWWDTAVRRELENPLLEIYYQELLQLGIHDYSFEELMRDYQLTVMQSLYIAASRCSNATEIQEFGWLWQRQLRLTLDACADLECGSLLKNLVVAQNREREILY